MAANDLQPNEEQYDCYQAEEHEERDHGMRPDHDKGAKDHVA
jgi:hypothetical protein